MKYRIIIITRGISEIIKPLWHADMAEVAGIIEAGHPSEIHHTLSTSDLETWCLSCGIPYFYMTHPTEILVNRVKELEPDLIVIYQMPQLLKKDIFSIPRFGAINLHPSLLPAYRGPNPWFWTYYNMETSGGVTVHFIDEGEDTGDIIYQSAFDIPLGIRLNDLKKTAIGKTGVRLLLKAIENIEKVIPIKQPKMSPTHRAASVKDFQNIIDFENWKIERVWHLLRGFPQLLNELPQSDDKKFADEWEVLDYHKSKLADINNSGHIIIQAENGKLVCHDGFINVRPAG